MIKRLGNILALAFALVMLAPAAGAAPYKIGAQAPDFTLRTLDGQTVRLADLRGQVILINFWATWCGPCKKELPTLDAFYALTSVHGLRAFAVTTEDSVPLSQMRGLATALHLPLVKGFKGPYRPVNDAVPSNFIIDRAGVLRYARAGAFDLDDLNRIVIPLLNEPAPAG